MMLVECLWEKIMLVQLLGVRGLGRLHGASCDLHGSYINPIAIEIAQGTYDFVPPVYRSVGRWREVLWFSSPCTNGATTTGTSVRSR